MHGNIQAYSAHTIRKHMTPCYLRPIECILYFRGSETRGFRVHTSHEYDPLTYIFAVSLFPNLRYAGGRGPSDAGLDWYGAHVQLHFR